MLEYLVRQPSQKTPVPPLLVMLHGYGSNKEDLFSLGPYLDPRLLTVSAQAPVEMTSQGVPGGFAWFPLAFTPAGVEYDRGEAREGIAMTVDFLKSTPKKLGAANGPLYLLGFSQGAMIAHAVLRECPGLLKGVAALSGRMTEELFDEGGIRGEHAGFPLFVSHGWYDEVLPVRNGRAIRDFYRKTPVDLVYREYPMGHEISPDCLADLKHWLTTGIDAFTAASR